MRLFTIGFTKKSAEGFFTKLSEGGARRVVDVRLNNVSQLAGFAKRQDLEYFLRELCGIDYVHLPELAPTKEMLDGYKKHKGGWEKYESGCRNTKPGGGDTARGGGCNAEPDGGAARLAQRRTRRRAQTTPKRWPQKSSMPAAAR
ncbi:MAG: DUF488 domain-containing protein [Nitrospira sp.]|nr:DUF488 domain-containing protein [Nitrospira sp.]